MQVLVGRARPPSSTNSQEGGRTDRFVLEVGNEPSAQRAAGHAMMDVLTLGIWEVLGSVGEVVQGQELTLVVQYNERDRVTNIVKHEELGGQMK